MTVHCSSVGKIRALIIFCCLALIFGIFGYAYLSEKYKEVVGKEEIQDNLDTPAEDLKEYDYISSYIKDFGVGNVNSYKLNTIETQLETDFYKELPEEKELAKVTVELFLEYFYDDIDLENKEDVTDAILKCLFASIGDPYAYYRTVDEFAEYLESLETTEEKAGIGVLINRTTAEILMVYTGLSAELAGIQPGDIITSVNGTWMNAENREELLNSIPGEPGTEVTIAIRRNNDLVSHEFTIMRTMFTGTVFYKVDADGVGYIQVTQFLEETESDFKDAVDHCVDGGAKALVIDMRYNPGGLLSSVTNMIDYLVPDAENRRIASYTQQGNEYVYYTKDGHSVDLPIAVLCNDQTASAGELFTAAMRDYAKDGILKTLIVGTKTYGKGIVQSSYTLYDLSGITYTIGYYNPPCNVNYDGIGITPDIVVVSSKPVRQFDKAKEEILKIAEDQPTTAFIENAA